MNRDDDAHRKAFSGGLALLAVTFGFEVDRARIGAYWQALHDLALADFTRAVQAIVATWRPEYNEKFPYPSTIRRFASPYVDVAAEGAQLFDAVDAMGQHTPHGYRWSIVAIGDKLGWAAAEAFAAAGGQSAFASTSDRALPFTRKLFIEAYVRAHQAAAFRLAPPVTQPPALPSGDPQVLQLTAGIGNGPRLATTTKEP